MKTRNRYQSEAALNVALASGIASRLSYREGNQSAATAMCTKVDDALESMLSGRADPSSIQEHDHLMHALGTAIVRAQHITGGSLGVPVLVAGAKVLNYSSTFWKVRHQWPVLDSDQADTLRQAVNLYKELLWASSPLQMEKAWREHLKGVQKLSTL